MLTATLRHRGKSGAELDTLDSIDTHEAAGDISLQLVENRFAEARRDVRYTHTDPGADRVTLFAQFVHETLKLR